MKQVYKIARILAILLLVVLNTAWSGIETVSPGRAGTYYTVLSTELNPQLKRTTMEDLIYTLNLDTIYCRTDGTTPLTADWDAGAFTIESKYYGADRYFSRAGNGFYLIPDTPSPLLGTNIFLDTDASLTANTGGDWSLSSSSGSVYVEDQLKTGSTDPYTFPDVGTSSYIDPSGYVLRTGATGNLSWYELATLLPSNYMAIGDGISSATDGSVLFVESTGTLQQDNANFFWDDTNDYLGIGTASPETFLDVRGVTYLRGDVTLKALPGPAGCADTYDITGNDANFNSITGVCNSGSALSFDAAGITATSTLLGDLKGGTVCQSSYVRTDGSVWSADSILIGGLTNCGGGGAYPHNYAFDPETGTDNQFMKLDGTGIATWDNLEIGDAVTSSTDGSVFFAENSSQLSQDNSNLFWDDSNNRLGIGTNAPAQKLHIVTGNIRLSGYYGMNWGSTSTRIEGNGSTQIKLIVNNKLNLHLTNTGAVGVNTTSPDALLQVNGDFYAGADATDRVLIQDDGDVVFEAGAGLVAGSCYGDEIAWTQASAVQNTWYDISDSDMNDEFLHNVTHDGNGQLTVTEPGWYAVDISGSFEVSIVNKHIQLAVSVNGTELAGYNHFEAFGSNKQQAMSVTKIIDCPDNATINASVRTTDTGTPDLGVDHLMIRVVQVGGT